MIVGVPRETYPGEHRVAVVPASLSALTKAKLECLVESGAGVAAGFGDDTYRERGARIAATRKELFASADVLLQVRALGANPEEGLSELELIRAGQTVIGFCDPLSAPDAAQQLAARGASLFSMELVPRITRAQVMDALSSMATIAGYKAVLLAADALAKMFPMLMTAAGAIAPARVLVIGAGVAGLQAIATARRLGAVVQGYDIRPAAKEEVQSLGAKFLELPLEATDAADAAGYAKAQDERFYQRQREMLHKAVAESDVVITTAAVPGKKAPVLVTAEMVAAMKPGAVIVDLAAERGGNCEMTRPGQTVETAGVRILGPDNLPATIPHHASQMYSKNITSLLLHLTRDGKLHLDIEDEITRETLVVHEGKVVHPRVREALGHDAAASSR